MRGRILLLILIYSITYARQHRNNYLKKIHLRSSPTHDIPGCDGAFGNTEKEKKKIRFIKSRRKNSENQKQRHSRRTSTYYYIWWQSSQKSKRRTTLNLFIIRMKRKNKNNKSTPTQRAYLSMSNHFIHKSYIKPYILCLVSLLVLNGSITRYMYTKNEKIKEKI